MPTPSPNPQYNPLPMFERGQASAAALYNAIAQLALDNAAYNQNLLSALESQVTALESRLAAVQPNFQQLVNNANSLQSQLSTETTENNIANTTLTGVESGLPTANSNADIQLGRVPAINTLINSLTIGEEIQGYSDLLQRIASAVRVADRILGVDSSTNIAWRQTGNIGSGSLIRPFLAVRRLTDTAAGGSVASLRTWFKIPIDTLVYNSTTTHFAWSAAQNQVTVSAGEYLVIAFAVGSTNGFQIRLQQSSTTTTLALGTPAKGTTATTISAAAEPINFVSRIAWTFQTIQQITLELQGWYDTAASTATNTQGASANITGYSPQQAALLLIRIIY
jgi:hypothetical protein